MLFSRFLLFFTVALSLSLGGVLEVSAGKKKPRPPVPAIPVIDATEKRKDPSRFAKWIFGTDENVWAVHDAPGEILRTTKKAQGLIRKAEEELSECAKLRKNIDETRKEVSPAVKKAKQAVTFMSNYAPVFGVFVLPLAFLVGVALTKYIISKKEVFDEKRRFGLASQEPVHTKQQVREKEKVKLFVR